MEFSYLTDSVTGYPHIYNHDVGEDEVEDVFDGIHQIIRGGGDTRIAVGRTSAGRYLKVVYVPDEALDAILVITAYQLRGKGQRAFRRWLRRKQRRR